LDIRETAASARDALLTAASDLMIELETPDVSLHAIARKAGLTAPLVKYYFGSKEGLLVALVERDTARSLAQLDGLRAMQIAPVAKLRIHITGIVRTYSRYPYLLGLLNQLLRGARSKAAEQIKASFVTPLINAQREIIEEGVASGDFRPLDPDKLYFIIVGACQYLFSTRIAFSSIMDGISTHEFEQDFANTAIDVLINGLRAHPSDKT
jgi:AcrR family transcriptional regulator